MKFKMLVLVACFITSTAVAQEVVTSAAGDEELRLDPVELGGGKPFMDVLQERQSIRNIGSQEIEPRLLSGLFWAANGYNRVEEKKRTAPSARNVQEIELYAITQKGVYKYEADEHQLRFLKKEDYRKQVSKSSFAAKAPLILILVANFDKMKDFQTTERDFYSALDAGYISQNIYLYCASSDLATVAMGSVEKEAVAKILGIKNGKVLLAHPVGYRE